jgi:hypothetical protein
MMEGRKALMSPSQLRTEASVRVWGRMVVSEMVGGEGRRTEDNASEGGREEEETKGDGEIEVEKNEEAG